MQSSLRSLGFGIRIFGGSLIVGQSSMMTMVHMLCQQVMDERRGKRIEEENIIFSTILQCSQSSIDKRVLISGFAAAPASHGSGFLKLPTKPQAQLFKVRRRRQITAKPGKTDTKTAFFFSLFYSFLNISLNYLLHKSIMRAKRMSIFWPFLMLFDQIFLSVYFLASIL